MRYFYSLLIALTFPSISNAQLAPQAKASLFDHLTEVNREWLNVEPTPELLEELSFSSETERIQKHLQLVVSALRATHGCNGESGDPVCELMNQLEAYADSGEFPRNLQIPFRQPHFIDDRGVACAVGHLMIENDFDDLAYAVHDTQNLVYVRELPEEALAEWMAASHLSVDEMAWIQPGYPVTTFWENEGANLTGTIYDMVVFNDELWVGGEFTIDGAACCLGKIENGEVVAATFNPSGIVKDLEVFQGKLYGAGQFEPFNNLMIYDGVDDNYSSIGLSKYPFGFKLYGTEEELFFSLDASGFVPESSIQVYDGSTWEEIGRPNMPVLTFTHFDGDLCVGGEFTSIYDNGYIDLNHVARWDGEMWMAMDGGIDDAVYDLEVVGDSLLAVGYLQDSNLDAHFGSAMWYSDQWTVSEWVGEGMELTEQIYWLEGVDMIDGSLTAWGDIPDYNAWIFGSNVGGLSFWQDVPTFSPWLGPCSGTVYHTVKFEGDYWICGDFVANDNSVQILAHTTPTPGLDNSFEIPELVISPNPASDFIRLSLADSRSRIVMTDMAGRIVLDKTVTGSNPQLDITALSTGNYVVTAISEGTMVGKGVLTVR